MDLVRKLKLFIVIISSILPAYADDMDHCEYPAHEECIALIPILPSLFQEIDSDNNGFLSLQELKYCSDVNKFNPIEILLIWSFRNSYRYISTLSDDSDFFEANELSFQDVEKYITGVVHSKHSKRLSFHLYNLQNGLFRRGIDSINYDSVIQGLIGDCGLISSIASLAHSRREEIYDMIIENKDGSFSVKLPDEEVIVVTLDIETLAIGSLAYSEGIWLYVIEMAILEIDMKKKPFESRVVNGVYIDGMFIDINKIDRKKTDRKKTDRKINKIFKKFHGIKSCCSIAYLTGNPTLGMNLDVSLNQKDISNLRQLLDFGNNHKKIMTVILKDAYCDNSCLKSDEMIDMIHDDRGNLTPIRKCDKNLITPYQKLSGSHAYSILSYDKISDIVVVRNPWGSSKCLNGKNKTISHLFPEVEPEDPETRQAIDGVNDGIFEMELNTFARIFDQVSVEDHYFRQFHAAIAP